MNLHAIVAGAISGVNPLVPVQVQVSIGKSTAPDGTPTPQWLPPVTVPGQVQALTYADLRQLEGLNLAGMQRAIYLYGEVNGIVRATNKGGDLITTPDGSVWLVNQVLEQWNDAGPPSWCKVAVTLQDQVPTSADFTDPRNSGVNQS